jgi:hypothetical protein
MRNPVLDAYDKCHPDPWWRRPKHATALELAAANLEECRREQLHHAHMLEEHKAEVTKLAEREKRLSKDVERLSRNSKPNRLDQAEVLVCTNGSPTSSSAVALGIGETLSTPRGSSQ